MLNNPIAKHLEHLTPSVILEQLNRYIIGQQDAKKAVAIALRSRYRRMLLPEDIQDDISPKNILLIGSTGVGKTEIARRLAKITKAPFVKVEATRFTEVGYVGRDVESMVRDLVTNSFYLVKKEKEKAVYNKALENTTSRLLDYLLPNAKERSSSDDNAQQALSSMRKKLENQELENEEITISISPRSNSDSNSFPMFTAISNTDMEQLGSQMQDLFGQLNQKKQDRTLPVKEARKILLEEELDKLINPEQVKAEAIDRAQHFGIIFLDEIDKITTNSSQNTGNVSREGVQRDLLPIVEGTTVHTRYGNIKTDYILFIAAGAFHFSNPSDLIPELQGRFPIRMKLKSLSQEELYQILKEPKNSLTVQYQALMKTENITLEFTDEALLFIAEYAQLTNEKVSNTGARRLQTILEKILEEISFDAPLLTGQTITITKEYAYDRLDHSFLDQDKLTHYIL